MDDGNGSDNSPDVSDPEYREALRIARSDLERGVAEGWLERCGVDPKSGEFMYRPIEPEG